MTKIMETYKSEKYPITDISRISEQKKITVSENERFKNEIIRRIKDIEMFFEHTSELICNKSFDQFSNECISELMDNTTYQTLVSDEFDCMCREFHTYMSYLDGRCDNVIETVKDFRTLSKNRYIYLVLNHIENELSEIKRGIYIFTSKEQL